MLRKFKNIQEASSAAVQYIVDLAVSAVLDKGFFSIVLAGGSTPRLTYELLSEPVNAEKIPWQESHFFWGDERWVAKEHPDSNFGMADKTLLSKVPIPPQNIHRITTEHKSPEIGAERYEEELRNFFYSSSGGELNSYLTGASMPSFDLVLLGMGSDGHTASLFPGSSLLTEQTKWVGAIPHNTGTPPLPRITLTLPVINQAKNIIFLISGKEKRDILNTILSKPQEAKKLYPAALISPTGSLFWLVVEKP